MLPLKKIKQTFVRQQGESACGVACLLSVLRYFGGQATHAHLAQLCGLSKQGSSMLGLAEAAQKLGMSATGYEGSLAALREVAHPCILYTKQGKAQQRLHYVVYYGLHQGKFVIGDPAQGILSMNEAELETMWPSKALLLLTSTDKLLQLPVVAPFQHLRKLLAAEWPLLFLSAILGLLLALLGLASAIFSQQLLDVWLPTRNWAKLGAGLALLTWASVLRLGLGYIRGNLLLLHQKLFNTRAMALFLKRMALLADFQWLSAGDWRVLASDLPRVQQLVVQLMGYLSIDAFALVISGALLAYYHWPSLLVVAIALPIYWMLSEKAQPLARQAHFASIETIASFESAYLSAANGRSVWRNQGAEVPIFGHLFHKYRMLNNAQWDLGNTQVRVNLWQEIAQATLTFIFMGLCGYWVSLSLLSTGQLVAMMGIWISLLGSMQRLSMLPMYWQEAALALERTAEVIHAAQPSCKQAFTSVLCRIQMENIVFRHAGTAVPILAGGSMFLEKGRLTWICGGSGAGKTTLLRVLQGWLPYQAGQLLAVNDLGESVEIAAIDAVQWRKNIGFSTQSDAPLQGSLLDNLRCFDQRISAQSVIAYCVALGFDAYFRKLPSGYYTQLGEGGVALSGGQRQLLALARALYRRPALLLLDEPFLGLDYQAVSFVSSLLMRYKKQAIILLVSHQAQETAAIADERYVLEEGILYERPILDPKAEH